jgi:hypothetical protein
LQSLHSLQTVNLLFVSLSGCSPDRAEACAAAGITTIHGNTIEVAGKVQQVSLLYLNPPYDFETGTSDNKRLEQVFLQHCYRWLVPGGILVFVIPEKALAYCSRTLAGRFADIRVYHLTHPDSVKYDQVVLFGVRKDQTDRAAERSQTFLNGLSWGRLSIDPLPELGEGLWTYTVPASGPAAFTHQGIDFDLLEDLLPQSNAWQQTRHALLPEAWWVKQWIKPKSSSSRALRNTWTLSVP